MENGSAASASGEDEDHHDEDAFPPIANVTFPFSNPTPPLSPTSPKASFAGEEKGHGAVGHKRSLSGNILSKLNFLRAANEDGKERKPSRDKEAQSPKSPKASREDEDEDESAVSPTSPKDGAMASALKQSKTRKRKGSLRKTALLGGRRFTLEGRERRNSLLQRSPPSKQPPVLSPTTPSDSDPSRTPPVQASDPDLPRKFSYEFPVVASSSDSGWLGPAPSQKLSLNTIKNEIATQHAAVNDNQAQLVSPIDVKSPTSTQSYASTTSDDDLSFDHPHTLAPVPKSKSPSSNASSYFPPQSTHSLSGSRRGSSAKAHSPLSALPAYPSPLPELEEHDYTETAYWGWVILIVTWIVFTVGMGSCLEIWSWAWDVGETPYAPPELEDDPTLPIVGYYPALIVLTGVVCWIWVSVAWVGMKYFRHAKIEV